MAAAATKLVIHADFIGPNENKMSDGWREGAWLVS
jgi:hypothetical protein